MRTSDTCPLSFLERPSEDLYPRGKNLCVRFEQVPENVIEPHVEKVVQVDLVDDRDDDVRCKRAVRCADHPKIADEEIVRDDIDAGISQHEVKVRFCFSNGI